MQKLLFLKIGSLSAAGGAALGGGGGLLMAKREIKKQGLDANKPEDKAKIKSIYLKYGLGGAVAGGAVGGVASMALKKAYNMGQQALKNSEATRENLADLRKTRDTIARNISRLPKLKTKEQLVSAMHLRQIRDDLTNKINDVEKIINSRNK